jgi:7,8-dihydropterin-6-yl-methyl-4-(beta-D-ribofuranosyl)aminobenzene 5'-phosphate synthase
MTNETISLQPVDKVEITTLCENLVDSQVPGSRQVQRLRAKAGGVVSDLFVNERPDPFVGAHGLSMLVRVTLDGRTRTILFDAGGSPDGLVHNLNCLEINPAEFSCIVLSHGHFDHIMGLIGLQRRLKRLQFPLMLHPDAYLNRAVALPGGQMNEIGAPSRRGLLDAGLDLIESRVPSYVLEDMALITGQVERTNDYEVGWPAHRALVDGAWTPDPLICDDQALVINLRSRGLVVLSGCGHAGIINTVSYARAITGVPDVHAVIGGFHLGGDYFQERVPNVVKDLLELTPALLAPAHCTGYRASMAIYQAMPDAYVQNTVGTRITLEAPEA